MTTTPLPYFFDEAVQRSNAKAPGDREKALNLTLDDLKWLSTVYKATQDARKTEASPMYAYRLLMNSRGKPDIPLAGAFAMSRPNNGEVVLYTPWRGLIKFADMNDLTIRLQQWLNQAIGKRELLRFLSIEQRSALLDDTELGISTSEIEGSVFEDQTQTMEDNRTQNIRAMMGELVKMPTLRSMLDVSLANALLKAFPTLDQRQTRLSSLSLSDVLLQFYLTNAWPADQPVHFSHPRHGVSSDNDNQTWKSAIKEIAQSLTPHLQSLIETFWNTSMNNGLPRSAFFSQCMQDAYHLNLLNKRQEGVLSAEEYLRLSNVTHAPATVDPLYIERVRITAPFKHYATLAGSFMIGSRDTPGYLYTQSRGIEATSDLPAVKKIVLQMLKSEGHDDTLLNFMSLDERRTVLEMDPDERTVIGVPIVDAVFDQLMADVLDKQRQNLSHALSRYRESEGTLDPHALLDNALDVRGLIDDRLLADDAQGRWSTHVDQRWIAQPATVRAELAKEQLKLLSSIELALEQRLDQQPAIPATTASFGEAERLISSSLQALQSDFTHTLATALRCELTLRTVSRTLGATEQAMIKALLDTPVRLQRAALNGFLPDVFSLALKAHDSPAPLPLSSCFVLTERGGLDPHHSGKAIVWTPALGFEVFPSLTPLLTELEKRLSDHNARASLLENLSIDERRPGITWTLAPLLRIDGHFLEHIQKPYVQLNQSSITNALASNLPEKTMSALLNTISLRQPKTGLHRASDIAHSLATQQKLPAWLAKASVKDLTLHAELLQQYLNNVIDDQDYLTGIRSLARTAHHELSKKLKADTFDIDPDNIRIKPRRMLSASPQTLTAFALIHHGDLEQIRFGLESLDGTPIPDAMNESYILDLIRNLDLGKSHRSTLDTAFAETGTQASQRKKRFYAQLPWQLMYYAHTERLQERLSETGFDLICQVMEMPDATARASIEGADATIRPLELRGIRSGQSIKVPGVWLIGKNGSVSQPQILIAPCSPTHGLKEYDGEPQLLRDLSTPGALQDWVLNSLPPTDRTLCKQRLTSTGNASHPVRLASSPLRGNVFSHLFHDNAALLARLLGCQSDNDSRIEWESIKHVLGEDLDQATSFFTGKLKYPIAVWRSYRDMKISAEELQLHKWGAAVRAFINAIAQLATVRQSMDSLTPMTSAHAEGAGRTPDTAIKWRDINITAPDRTRLKRHHAIDVDLGSLTRDTNLGFYTDPTTKKQYGAIEGNVYPVAKIGTRWRISDSKSHGPHLRQNAAKQWVLDRQTELPRFGMLNQIGTAVSAWAGMNVDAVGMPEIRLLYPVKARLIDEALDLATHYAWNSVRNLQSLKTTGNRFNPVHQLIKDFLGVPTVLPEYVQQIEKAIGDIFEALLDPSLRKPKSQRFAVGRVLEQTEHTFGFTVPRDETRRIYLAEKFFHPNLEHYRNYLSDATFPISAHARATTVIHELTHIVSKTVDIAYIDPGRPFSDLIETTSLRAAKLKRELSDVQGRSLSIRTPLSELFAVYDPDANIWEDLGDTTYENTNAVAAHILHLTGTESLDEARQSFMTNPLIRLAVQLSNADSVTWLISHLGRQLHTRIP